MANVTRLRHLLLGHYDYDTAHRVFELASIVVCLGLIAFFAISSVDGLRSLGVHALWAAPLSALAGYLGADLASGLFHWFGDTFGDPDTPILGPHFVGPFRAHHHDPRDITRHDFIEVNGNTCIVILVFVGPFYPLLDFEAAWGALIGLYLVVFACAIFGTNQFHLWAHLEPHEIPRVVRLAQRARLILSPEQHAVHHREPFDTYFCITSGWMNPILHRFHVHYYGEILVRCLTPNALARWINL